MNAGDSRAPQMTSKERLIAAMSGDPYDHPPFAPFLAYFWEAQPEPVRSRGRRAFLREIGADMLWRGAPSAIDHQTPGLEVNVSRRNGWTKVVYETPVGSLSEEYAESVEGNTRYLTRHAVTDPDHYKILAWIEEHTRLIVDPSRAREHLAADGSEGVSLGIPIHTRHPGLLKTAFQQLVEHWVGTEQLTYDLFDRPEIVDAVLKPMCERNREAVELSSELDEYDYFLTFEDSSTQNYSPEMYSTYIAPEIGDWQAILSRTGKRYVQHACGHLSGILDAISSQGIWGVESLSPPQTGDVSLREVRDRCGGSFGVVGGMEPVKMIDLTEEELPAYVESVLAENGGGRLVLANADSLPPQITVGKLRTIADHVRRLQ